MTDHKTAVTAATVHISSLIVHARPDRLEMVRRMILDHGAEIPVEDECGKLVCILETEDEKTISHFANTIAVADGVLSANLVYHLVDEPSVPKATRTEAGA